MIKFFLRLIFFGKFFEFNFFLSKIFYIFEFQGFFLKFLSWWNFFESIFFGVIFFFLKNFFLGFFYMEFLFCINFVSTLNLFLYKISKIIFFSNVWNSYFREEIFSLVIFVKFVHILIFTLGYFEKMLFVLIVFFFKNFFCWILITRRHFWKGNFLFVRKFFRLKIFFSKKVF